MSGAIRSRVDGKHLENWAFRKRVLKTLFRPEQFENASLSCPRTERWHHSTMWFMWSSFRQNKSKITRVLVSKLDVRFSMHFQSETFAVYGVRQGS